VQRWAGTTRPPAVQRLSLCRSGHLLVAGVASNEADCRSAEELSRGPIVSHWEHGGGPQSSEEEEWNQRSRGRGPPRRLRSGWHGGRSSPPAAAAPRTRRSGPHWWMVAASPSIGLGRMDWSVSPSRRGTAVMASASRAARHCSVRGMSPTCRLHPHLHLRTAVLLRPLSAFPLTSFPLPSPPSSMTSHFSLSPHRQCQVDLPALPDGGIRLWLRVCCRRLEL